MNEEVALSEDGFGQDSDESEEPAETDESTDGVDSTDGGGQEAEGNELARVCAERDAYFDALQRLQADFDNHRKRARREEVEFRERASEKVVAQLLPVLDALDLAAAHSDGEGGSDTAALTQIGTLLRDTLQREGLARIDAVGVSFDPNVHDAVAHDEAGSGQPVEVAEVLRAGYELKGKVLRPAMVRVRG
jgi:molecular chaperone GrpE